LIDKKHLFNKTIIRSYDIRGIYNKTLFDLDAKIIGNLFGLKVGKNQNVNIAYDGRLSSESLKNKLVEGLLEVGVNVTEIGLSPTPLLYFSCIKNKAAGGIMITGSHNPKHHNGFKFVFNNMPFYGDDLIKLSEKAKGFSFKRNRGKKFKQCFKDEYIKRIFKGINLKKRYRIAWDAGNGVAGELMSKIAKKINNQNFLLFENVDGNFPNHHPDPSNPKNLKDCINLIIQEKLDLGIAFDGDGDRIGVIDDKGRVLSGDQLLLLFSYEILKKKKGAKIIGDVKCSQILFDEIKKKLGIPIISQTGHSHVKVNIKKNKADLAGEMSGHIFFNLNYYGFDDALYSSVKLVELLDKQSKKLSEIVDQFPKAFNTPEIRLECNDLKKFEIINKVTSNQKRKNQEVIDIDGIRVSSENGWWLLRASNTQAELVLRCEANSLENLKKELSLVKEAIFEVDSELSDKILVENYV
jgi:phosphomannomutase